MSSIDYISNTVNRLVNKYKTRDPFEICNALDIRIRLKDLGQDIKAYYFYQSRIRNIVINSRVSETVRRILAAHELGHDRLHREIAMLKGFQELEMFDTAIPAEYEANLFAAELLIDDGELLGLLNDEDKTFFSVAKELYVPADLLDFKFRVLKHKGYRLNAPITAYGDFLKNDVAGCFEADDFKLC
ncbi:MAG: ImmA/IrrE family metallo-endopeptidase [Treponema sp.]|jgi:Zn-dependent peptidase ImmA (M78 family)|nr:ImmA/IrrE family metallo-endopeptidase [Treponema sp.]